MDISSPATPPSPAAPSSPTLPQNSEEPVISSTHSSRAFIPWIVSALLLVLVVILGAVILFTGSSSETIKDTFREWLLAEGDNEEESDKNTDDTDETDDASEEETEDEEDIDEDEDEDEDTVDEDDEENDADPAGMASEWSTYYNEEIDAGFKYPTDLTFDENTSDPDQTVVTFESGGNLSVFSAWFQSSGEMDNLLANMLSNQCTDEIAYSNITIASRSFRKGVDVPMDGCLEGFGITRDQELAAYGTLLPGEVILTIRNSLLNQEQLEAVLTTVFAD